MERRQAIIKSELTFIVAAIGMLAIIPVLIFAML